MQVSLNTSPSAALPPTTPARVKLIPLAGQALPLSPDGSPPVDFTLIAAGPMHTEYGTFQWTARSGKSVAEQWAKRNRRFMWDYEHFSTKVDKEGRPVVTNARDRSSCGSGIVSASSAGMQLTGQRWDKEAAELIREQKYLYFSPVIGVDETTGEIIDVLKSALTNDPATLGCAPLMLSADTEFTALSAEMSAAAGHVVADRVSDALAAKRLAVSTALASDSVVPSPDVGGTGPTPAPCGDSSMKPGEAADGKLSGLYDRETDPSIAGSRAAELTANAPAPATHGPPQSVAFTIANASHDPSAMLQNLGGPVSHAPELYAMDDSLAWDCTAACLRVWAWAGDDFVKARSAFSFVLGDGSSREDYKLIHHDVKGDSLVTVRGGVLEAVNSIEWANVPAEFLTPVRQHLQAEAARFGDRAPWVELSALAAKVLKGRPVALSADSDKHVKAMAEHPHGSPAKHNVASVLVHNADTGHTLWGRRHDSGKYTAPGGHVKEGEHPVDGAVRELKEETGLDLPRHHMSYMGTMRLSHPSNGAPMDVHGYSCSVPSHVKPDHEKDADKEVKGWEWHAEHPLSEMHAPINALSVLSAKHGGMQGMQNKMHPALHPAPSSETPNVKALDDNDSEMMDMNTLKALTATFISSGSSEGLTPEVEQKRQVALSAVKALDDALAAAGQKDGPVDLGALISLSETVAEKTGAKTGQVGAIISLAARAEAQPLALQLSTDQLKANFIELAFNGGRINGKTRQDVTAKIKSLSLADCEQLNKGPKIYEAPNNAPAPQGDNSATRTVELGIDNGHRPSQGITAEVPADLVGKKVELTSADLAAIASAAQNGVKIDPAKVLASKQALAAQGNKGVRVMQHPGSRQ